MSRFMELINFLVEDIILYRVSELVVEGVTLHGILFERFNSDVVQYQSCSTSPIMRK
jgi:hypothetical protein